MYLMQHSINFNIKFHAKNSSGGKWSILFLLVYCWDDLLVNSYFDIIIIQSFVNEVKCLIKNIFSKWVIPFNSLLGGGLACLLLYLILIIWFLLLRKLHTFKNHLYSAQEGIFDLQL